MTVLHRLRRMLIGILLEPLIVLVLVLPLIVIVITLYIQTLLLVAILLLVARRLLLLSHHTPVLTRECFSFLIDLPLLLNIEN